MSTPACGGPRHTIHSAPFGSRPVPACNNFYLKPLYQLWRGAILNRTKVYILIKKGRQMSAQHYHGNLSEVLHEALKHEAERRGQPLETLIAEGLQHYWEMHSVAAGGPWLRLVRVQPEAWFLRDRQNQAGPDAAPYGNPLPTGTICVQCSEDISGKSDTWFLSGRLPSNVPEYICAPCVGWLKSPAH